MTDGLELKQSVYIYQKFNHKGRFSDELPLYTEERLCNYETKHKKWLRKN